MRELSPYLFVWVPTAEEEAAFERDRALHWILVRVFVHLETVIAERS
jgi:hypothetical protein